MPKDTTEIKEQLGNDPDTFPVLVKLSDPVFIMQEGPVKFETETLGHSWICGSSTNGIVGTNTNTEDGQQQVVGGAGRDEVISRIYNNDNTFIERFVFTDYIDLLNTDATIDTTEGKVTFAQGEILTTEEIYLDTTTVTKVTIILDENDID